MAHRVQAGQKPAQLYLRLANPLARCVVLHAPHNCVHTVWQRVRARAQEPTLKAVEPSRVVCQRQTAVVQSLQVEYQQVKVAKPRKRNPPRASVRLRRHLAGKRLMSRLQDDRAICDEHLHGSKPLNMGLLRVHHQMLKEAMHAIHAHMRLPCQKGVGDDFAGELTVDHQRLRELKPRGVEPCHEVNCASPNPTANENNPANATKLSKPAKTSTPQTR
jgi:hypothetical protein